MKVTCQSRYCKGQIKFTVTSNSDGSNVVVCGNHLSWAIRSLSTNTDAELTVTNVKPKHIPSDPTRRVANGPPIEQV